MKAIGIVGSPRRNGNTEILTGHTLKAIAEEGLDTELIRLADLDIRPCNACMACQDEEHCPINDDFFPIYIKMKEAEAIILASPVYFGSATALLKALMERAGYIARHNGRLFTGKVGGPITVARRAGHNLAFSQLLLWFFINGITVPGSTYWNVGVAGAGGARDAEDDEEGLATVTNFANNMVKVMKKLFA